MYAGICPGACQVFSFIVCSDKSVSYLPEAPQILFNFPDSHGPFPFLTLEHGPHTGLTFGMCVLVWGKNHVCVHTCRNLRSAPMSLPCPPRPHFILFSETWFLTVSHLLGYGGKELQGHTCFYPKLEEIQEHAPMSAAPLFPRHSTFCLLPGFWELPLHPRKNVPIQRQLLRKS